MSNTRLKIAELKKELSELYKVEFIDAAKTLFDGVSGLESVSLYGYAPSFNDGDPCEWGLHEGNVKMKDMDEEYWEEIGCSPEDSDKINDFFGSMHTLSDYIQDAYGYDTKLTFSKNSDGKVVVETEDYYDHD